MGSDCIVGIDGSDEAVGALIWAACHAGDASIVAASAWHVPLMLKALMARRAFDVDRIGLAAEAGHHLDDAVARVTAALDDPPAIRRDVIEGQPADVLLDLAGSAAMLVLGRSGAGELRHLVLGSVSRHCATHATVPTVVVPPGAGAAPLRSIAVGVDGSEASLVALRWALERSDGDEGAGATVTAHTAIDVSPWLDETTTRSRLGDDIADEERRIADAIAVVVAEHGTVARFEHRVVLGGPRHVLSTAAVDADLLVVGTRTHGPLTAAWLGSVATWMLQSAPCPVAVVPS